MIFSFKDFKGEIPARDVRLLPGNYAQKAENVNLDTGTIAPVKKTIPRDPTTWAFVDEAGVDVVPANVSGVNRLLVSGLSGYPEARQGSLVRRWGVVTPTTIPTVSKGGSPVEGAVVKDTVSYVYTLVTEWGEESAISGASMPVDVYEGEYVILSNFDVPTLLDSGNNITHIRVYRTATGETGSTEFQMVPVRTSLGGSTMFDVPTTYVNDPSDQLWDHNDAQDGVHWNLGDTQVTEGWDPPPDGAHSGIEYANGVYALVKGKRVYLSVPGYYYAFPASGLLDYSFELEYDGVGLGVYNQQLIVCTTAFPEIISGVDPQSATRYQLPWQNPCLSKKSIVSLPNGVFYVSEDGGVLATDAAAPVITTPYFTRDQWRSYPLSSALCAYWNNKIYVFFSGYDYGFAMDLSREYVVFFNNIGFAVTDIFVDPEEDRLYLNSTSGWQAWEGDSACLPMTYQTVLRSVHPTSFSCARVDGTCLDGVCGNVTLKIWADGSLLFEKDIDSIEPFRIPGGGLYREWYFEVLGTGQPEIYTLYLAHSMEELKANA